MIKKKSHEMGVLGNQKKKCPNFDKGTCTFGAMCNNSHSFIPDIAKVRIFIFRNNAKTSQSTYAKKVNFALFLTIFRDSHVKSFTLSETARK